MILTKRRGRQGVAILRQFLSLALVASQIGAPALPARGQPGPAPQQEGPPLRVDVNLVLVEATVKDPAGRVKNDLAKDDFLVSENGAPQAIAHFSRYQIPLAVALVVDLSNSISPFLTPLRYATRTALRTLKSDDQVALFTFTDQVERRAELMSDKQKISEQIETFSAQGNTNINGALYEAANYLRDQAPAARRIIILVSDNVPTTSTVPSKQVLDAILRADAALYDLKVPGHNPWQVRMAAKMAGQDLVNVGKLAAETGGEIFEVEKEGSLYLAFAALIERLKTRYTLGFYPTNPARNGRFRSLTVTLQPRFGSPGKDYTVLAKRGYFAK